MAGGFELLLGCDVVVASEAASFGLPEVKRGLFAAGGGVFISTRIPLAVALELTLTGDPIDAGRALSLGSDQSGGPARRRAPRRRRVGRARSHGTAHSRCRPPSSWCVLRRPISKEGARRAVEWQPKVFGSEDAKEGATAFIEKRDPVWKGALRSPFRTG